MHKQHRLGFSSDLIVFISIVSLVSMILAQAFSTSSFANASNRDEFPGRRQGGGTHWVIPTPANFE
jgi:hypothetical protein